MLMISNNKLIFKQLMAYISQNYAENWAGKKKPEKIFRKNLEKIPKSLKIWQNIPKSKEKFLIPKIFVRFF